MFKIHTILLADDDDDDRLLFQDALEQISANVKVIIAADGEQMVDMLSEGTLPDVIFLDLNMPRKNGFECLEEIRSSNSLAKNVPIIIFSTTSQQDTIDKVYDLGATYYICKPQTFPKLKAVLKEALSADLTPGITVPPERFVLRCI